MRHYEKYFSRHKHKVAQVLLTHDDLSHRQRFLNARTTLFTLLQLGVIPVINENDSVVVDEITFGDNDHLSALVTNLVEADLLLILTDTDGLHNRDPRRSRAAELIPLVESIDERVEKLAAGATSKTGTGGMITKVEAARCAGAFGTPTIIANGKRDKTLRDVFAGREVGTLFLPPQDKLTSRKHWIAYNLRTKGCLVVDSGARRAVVRRGKSLLPSGLLEVRGEFERGELVRCLDPEENEFAKGLVNYSSSELAQIKGLNTREIAKRLGYHYYDEVIHRDDLVLLKGTHDGN
jgi:glutamate 5-kinase